MHLYVSLLAETRAKLRRATHIDELIRDWNSAPPDVFIFQTGVGTRALFAATDLLGLTDILLRLLDSAQVVVRGPKPATVLHSRKARIDGAASDPFGAQLLATPLGAKEATAVLISLIAGIRSLCAHRGVPERRPSRRLSLETLRPRIHPSRACSR
jgi:hypothetical protein